MAKEDIKTLKEQKIDTYKLTLTRRLGWVGSPYYRYDLKNKNLFGHYKLKANLSILLKDTVNCEIELSGKRGKIYRVDKCKQTVIIIN